MVIIKVKGKEFDIEKDLLEKNQNFLVTLNLKNKDMMTEEFDYPEHDPFIFEKFVIPVLENKLDVEKIQKNMYEKFNKGCVDTYNELVMLVEYFNIVEEELNFFGFNSLNNCLDMDENMKVFIRSTLGAEYALHSIKSLIIKINYDDNKFYELNEEKPELSTNKILVNYFSESKKIEFREVSCLIVTSGFSIDYIIYKEDIINDLKKIIKNKATHKEIIVFITVNKLVAFYGHTSHKNRKKIYDSDDTDIEYSISRLINITSRTNEISEQRIQIYESACFVRTLKE